MRYVLGLSFFLAACATPSSSNARKSTAMERPFFHIKREASTPFETTFLHPVLIEAARTKNRIINDKRHSQSSLNSPSYATSVATLWFNVYQQTWSRLDGATCNFYPTCSQFGLDAFRKWGPMGFFMTFGRLEKNHADSHFYSHLNRSPRLLDPLENYIFWMRDTKEDDFQAYRDPAHAWFQHVRLVNE